MPRIGLSELEGFLGQYQSKEITVEDKDIDSVGLHLNGHTVRTKTGVYNSFIKQLKLSATELEKYKPHVQSLVVKSFLPKRTFLIEKNNEPYAFRNTPLATTEKIVKTKEKLEKMGFNEVVPVEGITHDYVGQRPALSFRFLGPSLNLFPTETFENSLELLVSPDALRREDMFINPAFVKDSCTNVILGAGEMRQRVHEDFDRYVDRVATFWNKMETHMRASSELQIHAPVLRLQKITTIPNEFIKILQLTDPISLYSLINELTLKAQSVALDIRRKIEILAARMLLEIYEGKRKQAGLKEILLG